MSTTSFQYLPETLVYLDQACQSMRPKQVIETELKYYTNVNSCGGRGNHEMVTKVDQVIYSTRKLILDFIGKNNDQYTVVFCPNTTTGINMLLSNLDWSEYREVVTTNKEHNSVYLPSISFARKYSKKLKVLIQQDEGFDSASLADIKEAVCLLGVTSNLDGQNLPELEMTVQTLKSENNLVLLDATQSLAHQKIDLFDLDFDCLFASGHKLYAPSIGFMVIKKNLLRNLDQSWVGGGTVQKVRPTKYELINIETDLASRFEFGLQDYAAIFGLNEAIDWLMNYKIKKEYPKINYDHSSQISLHEKFLSVGPSKEAIYYIEAMSEYLFKGLKELSTNKKIKLINKKPSCILSFIPIGVDSNNVTKNLSKQNIIARSGFMCCHNYVRETLKSSGLVRFSLGLHNTPSDIITVLKILEKTFG